MIRYPLFKDWWIFIFVFCQIVCCLLFGNPAVGGGIIFDNAEAIATLLLFVVCGCLLLVFVSFLCCCFSSSDFLLLFVFSFLCCCLLSFSLLFWNLAAGGIVVNNAEAAVFLSISLFVCLSVCFLFSVSLLLFYVCFLCFIYCCCREIQRLMGLSSTVQRPQQLRCFTPTAEAWRLLRNVTFSFITYSL